MAASQRPVSTADDLPRRSSGETPASIAAIIRTEQLDIDANDEIRHHANGEWLMDLQQADAIARAQGMSSVEKALLIEALRARNRAVWGRYSDA